MASLSQYYISVAFQHAHPAAAAATRSPAAAWQQLTHGYSKLSSRTLSVASHPHWLRLRGCEETLRAVLARLVHILPIGARHRRLRTTASFDASWQASTVKHHTKMVHGKFSRGTKVICHPKEDHSELCEGSASKSLPRNTQSSFGFPHRAVCRNVKGKGCDRLR